jgi:hypothetical protein
MPTTGRSVQFSEVGEQLCPQGVQVNVADQFLKVGAFFAKDGLVAVLEELAVATMTEFKVHRIAGKQPPHDGGYTARTGSQEKVGMVG